MFGVLKEQGGQCGRGVKGENNYPQVMGAG